MVDSNEKRDSPRVPLLVKVIDGTKTQDFYSREVSTGGLFLETQNAYGIGKRFEIEFQIPGSQHLIRVQGEVAHCSDGINSPLPQGVGVKFLNLSGNDEQAISDYIEKLVRIRQKLSSP